MTMDEYEKYQLIQHHADAIRDYAARAISERHGDDNDFADRIKVRCARIVELANEVIGVS